VAVDYGILYNRVALALYCNHYPQILVDSAIIFDLLDDYRAILLMALRRPSLASFVDNLLYSLAMVTLQVHFLVRQPQTIESIVMRRNSSKCPKVQVESLTGLSHYADNRIILPELPHTQRNAETYRKM
jgi:hypothetical protein